jgi:dTDP-4-dehydrorhamnose reductase
VVSPTYVPDLVHGCLDLLLDEAQGVWHLTNSDGALSWAELARRTAALAGLPEALVEGVPHQQLGMAARRPRYSALASERGWILPSLDTALTRWFAELDPRAFRV